MKKVTKKILSVALVFVMSLTAMPLVFAEGEIYEVGDIIQFGSYPQSEVKDETLIAELNALAPEWDDWTSYGYYSGDGSVGSMVPGDWMRYIDVTYNGSKYRGVRFTEYRSSLTYCDHSNSKQIQNGYYCNTTYWFKFEPIDWRVLDPATGLVMCETIIDSQPYSNTIYYNSSVSDSRYAYFNDSSYKNYASDYETSSIRQWLNNEFYNTAFASTEKKEINASSLNNDGYYTSIGETGYEDLDSNLTNDKIFLLSYNEAINSKFGFYSNAGSHESRFGQGSDYAQSQGLYVYRNNGETGSQSDIYYNNNSTWLLRSPSGFSYHCCYVYYRGSLGWTYFCELYTTKAGIRPALRLRDIYNYNHNHQHSYNSVITDSTCTEQGFTTYICECGDSYISDYVNAKGHKDDNSDYKCDYGCGYEYEKPASSDPTDNCSCNCHAGGIKTFFFKILNFFQKLFGKNKVCACGAKH